MLELMGEDRVIFGSDWPHIEGMPTPLDYLDELAGIDPTTVEKIVHTNATHLNERRPASS